MTGTYDYDLVCIGSGSAGQRAAVQAGKLRMHVAVVERRGGEPADRRAAAFSYRRNLSLEVEDTKD